MKISLSIVLAFFLVTVATNCGGLKPNPKYKESGSSEIEPTPERDYGLSANFEPASPFERELASAIESYLGVPYRFGGTTRRGLDCSGFVNIVYGEAVDMKLPRRARSMFKSGRFVPEERLNFGDLVFFENIENYGVSHVGIYVGDSKFAHASTSRGVIISDLNYDYYKKRYIGARRVFAKSQ